MNVLDLFSGIGGFSLGLERAGMRTVAFCEDNSECQRVIRTHWPRVPIHDDVRTLNYDRLRYVLGAWPVDVICGGFPCQPFSTAARGRNNAIDLWPQFLRLVGEILPDWVIAENVPGIGTAGIDRVCSDLEGAGYEVWPFDLDTALPQRQRGRHRFIWVAYYHREGQSRLAEHAQVAGLRAISDQRWPNDPAPVGMDDGLPGRMDRLGMLGNAITPVAAEVVGRAIMRMPQ